jgi:hypothetical protein
MNEKIKLLAEQAGLGQERWTTAEQFNSFLDKFGELIVAECVEIIESQQVPVGNSAAGEMAADWTIAALSECRTEIKEHFGGKE